MKKKIFVLLILSIFLSIVCISQNLSIYKHVNDAWVEETNLSIASVQGSGVWNTGGYIPLEENIWYPLPKINLNAEISQWMFMSIQYLNYDIHVNMPGDYTLDSLTIQVETNGGVYAYFQTGGWFSDIIPTWIGYKIDDSTLPPLGLPSNNSNNNFWHDMNLININYGNSGQKITIGGPSAWSHTFYGWLGFRVGNSVPKGQYSTYMDIYIQSDP